MKKHEVAVKALDLLLDAVYEWQAAADKFVATGSDDDDVIVTHDSRGRLIECNVRPGLQQELTLDELNDRVNDAIEANVGRARQGMDKIRGEFLAKCQQVLAMTGPHPVGEELTAALNGGPSEEEPW